MIDDDDDDDDDDDGDDKKSPDVVKRRGRQLNSSVTYCGRLSQLQINSFVAQMLLLLQSISLHTLA